MAPRRKKSKSKSKSNTRTRPTRGSKRKRLEPEEKEENDSPSKKFKFIHYIGGAQEKRKEILSSEIYRDRHVFVHSVYSFDSDGQAFFQQFSFLTLGICDPNLLTDMRKSGFKREFRQHRTSLLNTAILNCTNRELDYTVSSMLSIDKDIYEELKMGDEKMDVSSINSLLIHINSATELFPNVTTGLFPDVTENYLSFRRFKIDEKESVFVMTCPKHTYPTLVFTCEGLTNMLRIWTMWNKMQPEEIVYHPPFKCYRLKVKALKLTLSPFARFVLTSDRVNKQHDFENRMASSSSSVTMPPGIVRDHEFLLRQLKLEYNDLNNIKINPSNRRRYKSDSERYAEFANSCIGFIDEDEEEKKLLMTFDEKTARLIRRHHLPNCCFYCMYHNLACNSDTVCSNLGQRVKPTPDVLEAFAIITEIRSLLPLMKLYVGSPNFEHVFSVLDGLFRSMSSNSIDEDDFKKLKSIAVKCDIYKVNSLGNELCDVMNRTSLRYVGPNHDPRMQTTACAKFLTPFLDNCQYSYSCRPFKCTFHFAPTKVKGGQKVTFTKERESIYSIGEPLEKWPLQPRKYIQKKKYGYEPPILYNVDSKLFKEHEELLYRLVWQNIFVTPQSPPPSSLPVQCSSRITKIQLAFLKATGNYFASAKLISRIGVQFNIINDRWSKSINGESEVSCEAMVQLLSKYVRRNSCGSPFL